MGTKRSLRNDRSTRSGTASVINTLLIWGGVSGFFVGNACVYGQGVPAPGVDWRSITYEDDRPTFGFNYSWNGSQFALNGTSPNGEEQTREETSEEWWYNVTNYYDQFGDHVAYITVGYAFWANWAWGQVGCRDGTIGGAPVLFELESTQRVKGSQRGTIAMFNLQGQLIWYTALQPGDLYGVTQTSDGNIVVAGTSQTNALMPDMPQTLPVYYNPVGGTGTNAAIEPCSLYTNGFGGKPYLANLSSDGTLLWLNFYGSQSTLMDAWETGGRFFDVCEVEVNGAMEYCVVGTYAGAGFVVRTDQGGNVIAKKLYEQAEPHFMAQGISAYMDNGNDPTSVEFRGISWQAIDPHPDGGKVALSGSYFRQLYFEPTDEWLGNQAMVTVLDLESADPFALASFFHHTSSATDPVVVSGGIDPLRQNNTWGVSFVRTAGTTRLIWPVLSNFYEFTESGYNSTASRKSIAFLKVHGWDMGGSLLWSQDLGEVRAYDLQADGFATDGGDTYSVVCSKWPPPFEYSGGPVNPDPIRFDWDDLNPDAQQCLTDNFTIDPAGMNAPYDWPTNEYDFSYWNTNAYVAKLDPTNGAVIWETQFDSDPDREAECTPGDLRKQECMYKITEAPDGGLVVCGNTSHNLDDYYLAKLDPPCQAEGVTYTDLDNFSGAWDQATYTYTAGGFGGTEVWDQDMTLHGTFVVPDGVTLKIENAALIRFADSKLLDHNTRVVVQKGGKLIVREAAHLTHLNTCPNALWDGILNQGDASLSQSQDENQGKVILSSDATISRARVGVLMAQDYPDNYTTLYLIKSVSGGWLQANNAHFTDNLRDVVFSPYENHAVGDPTHILPNRSHFADCQFRKMNNVQDHDGTVPSDHAFLTMVRGVDFLACEFLNVGMVMATTGIRAINSTFIVRGRCPVLVPFPQPCPDPIVRSRFVNLTYGIHTVTFDLSRTFVADQTDFIECARGIRMEGHQDPGITRCTFDVSDPFSSGLLYQYGVYSDQCTGYEIEENTFSSTSDHILTRHVGLVIKDSGPNSNMFYNNSFDGLHVGSIIEGKNADATNQFATGLEIKCNDYGLTTKNDYDVALTGSDVAIRESQGSPGGSATDPAGNRFSLLHDGVFDLEEDWSVDDEATTNTAVYYHHDPEPGSRTIPAYRSTSDLLLNPTLVPWPGKETACPTRLSEGGTREEERLASLAADGEKQDAEEAYDAAKDNGDTYTLLGYVSDESKSSAQVRTALQSVAPKASLEVWTATFGRSNALTNFHFAQALLSNSPLQSEVLQLMDNSALSPYYKQLVWNGQDGSVSILTLMECAIAYHAKEKAEALTDLGRLSWLDKTDLATALDELEAWHAGLPAENNATAMSGVLTAKTEHIALLSFAEAEVVASSTPEVFGVIKRYAIAMQNAGWDEPDAADRTWVEALAAQRHVIGSAHANAWLQALGTTAPEEVVILPVNTRRPDPTPPSTQGTSLTTGTSLDAIPNPTSGPIVFVRTGETAVDQLLRISDLSGRVLAQFAIADHEQLIAIGTTELAAGAYIAEWLATGSAKTTVRFSVQN